MSGIGNIISLPWSGRTWPYIYFMTLRAVNFWIMNCTYSVRGFALSFSDPGFPDTTSNVLAWSGRTRLLFGVKDSYFYLQSYF